VIPAAGEILEDGRQAVGQSATVLKARGPVVSASFRCRIRDGPYWPEIPWHGAGLGRDRPPAPRAVLKNWRIDPSERVTLLCRRVRRVRRERAI